MAAANCPRWAGKLLKTVRQNAFAGEKIGSFLRKTDVRTINATEINDKTRKTQGKTAERRDEKLRKKLRKTSGFAQNKNIWKDLILF
jgi:hypothetical protein